MRLAVKFVLVFLAGTVTVLLVYGVFAVERERALFENDVERDTRLVGRSIRIAVLDVWSEQGQAKALQLIEDFNRQEPDLEVRWIAAQQISERLDTLDSSMESRDRLARGEEVSLRRPTGEDPRVLTFVPVERDGHRIGVLAVSKSLQPADDYTRATIVRFAALAAIISLLAAGLAIPIGITTVGSPLARLVEKTRRAGRGDFAGEIEIRSQDELGELGGAVNAMCRELETFQRRIHEESEARIEALEQLRHEDRLKTVGTLASGVAHELGTPLNVIGGRAGLIEQGRLDADEVVEAARVIRQQANSMTAIVRQLLDFARRRAPEKSKVDLVAVVEQAIEMLRPMARKQGVDLAFGASGDRVEAEVDASQLQQVITNLVLNAVQASSSGDRVTVRLEPAAADEGGQVRLLVQDEGRGISPAALPHIFEPFFTTKGTGEGTGLGLSLVYGIVQEHGGRVEVVSRTGEGARFEVCLPVGGET